MKEVTRIHIARVSYDIELAAKKKLESYIDALSTYAEDDNVLEDIEIRITELLEKRGVNRDNGVITASDVASIRETLGEPQYFSGEGDMAIGPEDEDDIYERRKLYRDIDNAVLGGVLSGTAHLLKINPVWVRLAFIILLFISFGGAAFVYAVLWVAIPAAKTVTEKLQMQGQPATLGNIRKYNESHTNTPSTKERLHIRRKGFGIAIGIVGVLGSVAAAVTTIVATVAWVLYQSHADRTFDNMWLIFGLLLASGVLLTMLGALVGYCGFKARVTKRSVIAGIIIIALGLLSFGAASGITSYQAWQHDEAVRQSINERSVTVPEKFAAVHHLIIDVEYAMIDYRVSDDTRATISAVPGVSAHIVQTNDTATVSVSVARIADAYNYRPTVVIYGPALESLDLKNGSAQYTSKTQELSLTIAEGTQTDLYGNYTKVQADVKGALGAEGASVKAAVVTMEASASVNLGNINTLTVNQPTACPNNSTAQLWVEGMNAATLTYNGMEIPKADQDMACGSVQFGQRDGNY